MAKQFTGSLLTTLIGTAALLGSAAAFTASANADADTHPLAELPLREIGPAYPSGRISDFAFHPTQPHRFYVATASGGLWYTPDNTTSWQPLFDGEGAFALGVVEIDPQDSLTVWVGTGENNAQRSVAMGDGVYRSTDGGKNWSNMGLGDSGHIGKIWIDPRDSDHLLVAAQGPLWSDGGDRGLYQSRDGGEKWSRILNVDRHTGVNEFVVHPEHPERIVASSWQRRRHVWTLINGGPGSGIHRSEDGGKTWVRVKSKLPKDHMGRIGLAMAPSAPNTLYAIIEALDEEEKGVYRSLDFGQNWEKRSDFVAGSPQYYNELIVDPHNPDRVYAMDTFARISEDGGKTWRKLSLDHKHVDDHALWIDPQNTAHLYIGGDGGIYESWDRGQRWRHVPNLPIVQFYRIQPDNESPFYNVCGGTQDNNSLCAPSRTSSVHGLTNSSWRTVLGGDGYKPQIDPNDPNIIYVQYQYGGLARYDRRSGERVWIAPQPEAGQTAPKWNWNTPLLISPHAATRLYYAAEHLYRSDDRGDSWTRISPDLTRQLDRNKLPVMGRVWSVDAVAKNDSTSRYGSAIGLSESPLQEGLIYVGTDDGLISVTDDGGKSWRRTSNFRGVPKQAYVDDVVASVHDADVAYAIVDNHKRGDYRPYVLKTSNRGRSWKRIDSNLPARGYAHTIAEDHGDPNLLFVGTEYGLFFTQDGGDHWTRLSALPTIAVRDLEIQRRENDLVVGTFGRGIWILDDYRALRSSSDTLKDQPASLFPVRDAWIYVEDDFYDRRPRGSRGHNFWRADNPPTGAVFRFYLKDSIEAAAKTRRQAETKKESAGEDTPYPSWDQLRAEDQEEAPAVLLLVRDQEGNIVRRIPAKGNAGLQEVAWDLRYPPLETINLSPEPNPPYWVTPPIGPLALPGVYTVEIAVRRNGELSPLGAPQSFALKSWERSPEISKDRSGIFAFQQEAGSVYRAVAGAATRFAELEPRIAALREALRQTPGDIEALRTRLNALVERHDALSIILRGDDTVTGRNESAPWSLIRRINWVFVNTLESQSAIPAGYFSSLAVAKAQWAKVQPELATLTRELTELESDATAQGAPWSPGRVGGL